METNVIPIDTDITKSMAARINLRMLSADDWIEAHASGTLRKNKRIGFAWRTQYLQERIAYEFGFHWEMLPRTYVTFGDAVTEGDCHAITEAGWHIERYLAFKLFAEDYFETKRIKVEYPAGEAKEGIGLVLRETSAPWIPKGHLVFIIMVEYDPRTNNWKPDAITCF